MEIDELITVVPYQPHWPDLFHQEQQRLQQTLTKHIFDIQHIGSTAVPGLAAKPIIDILIGLQTLSNVSFPIIALQTLSYEYLGEAGIPGRLYFRRRQERAFNIHLVQWGSELWTNNLLLRDFLCTHPEVASRYGQHKQELIKSGVRTLLAYSEKKDSLVAELLHRAQVWRALYCSSVD
ncbi:GrpB family protein [Cyanosarcina cf. burmensis CCALA 770]|nr:GrpB family protein [Cyanosarcina cf. burmensis CCALA 770]